MRESMSSLPRRRSDKMQSSICSSRSGQEPTCCLYSSRTSTKLSKARLRLHSMRNLRKVSLNPTMTKLWQLRSRPQQLVMVPTVQVHQVLQVVEQASEEPSNLSSPTQAPTLNPNKMRPVLQSTKTNLPWAKSSH